MFKIYNYYGSAFIFEFQTFIYVIRVCYTKYSLTFFVGL